uniref:eukaryotic translation initiation factor 5 isoform X1 n=1 Tax=Ciona intestinalis TaxID=7719 RepID=UPI00006A3431|nr:eukaryotic translation initiation factor 5 isoform X1 [Ciona intestinalis]|eukprot:XP_002125498.1 eukaryotic translation initiation factor 5 isoform X1 [Ciona intestinalis]
MAMLNVNRDVQDVFYRYKMPCIIAKVEGKGNGVKTVIVNMSDVAKAIGRPATYACKFFGCELGAQTQFDLKNDRYIVNGSHENTRLQDMLDIFIKKFVLCNECENPETTMIVKRGTIGLVCKACGNQSLVDLRHKLCTYIIKNPPQKDKKEKSKPTKGRERGHSSEEENSANAAKKNGNKENNNGVANGASDSFGDDDWSVDVSEAAVAARMNEITSGAATLALTDDLERTPSERADMLYGFIKKRINANTIMTASKDIAIEAERLDMKSKAPLILVELLCNENMREQIKTYRNHFIRLCHGNKKAQKALLGAFEKTVELHKDALLPKVAHIVKDLYDQDIVDEEVIIEWGEHPSKKYVSKELSKMIHSRAAPVVNWLKEAEEESSEEEEEEIEIEYTTRAGTGLQVEDIPTANGNHANGDAPPAEEEENGGDDFDIDDI